MGGGLRPAMDCNRLVMVMVKLKPEIESNREATGKRYHTEYVD